MSQPPRTPPRFVPTLTEVVDGQALAPQAPQAPQDSPRPALPAPAPALAAVPPGFEEYVVHRVMQRVDGILEHHLSEAIALVIEEQTRSMVPRLREEVESVVRHAVYEAVAQELAAPERRSR